MDNKAFTPVPRVRGRFIPGKRRDDSFNVKTARRPHGLMFTKEELVNEDDIKRRISDSKYRIGQISDSFNVKTARRPHGLMFTKEDLINEDDIKRRISDSKYRIGQISEYVSFHPESKDSALNRNRVHLRSSIMRNERRLSDLYLDIGCRFKDCKYDAVCTYRHSCKYRHTEEQKKAWRMEIAKAEYDKEQEHYLKNKDQYISLGKLISDVYSVDIGTILLDYVTMPNYVLKILDMFYQIVITPCQLCKVPIFTHSNECPLLTHLTHDHYYTQIKLSSISDIVGSKKELHISRLSDLGFKLIEKKDCCCNPFHIKVMARAIKMSGFSEKTTHVAYYPSGCISCDDKSIDHMIFKEVHFPDYLDRSVGAGVFIHSYCLESLPETDKNIFSVSRDLIVVP